MKARPIQWSQEESKKTGKTRQGPKEERRWQE